MSVTAIAINCTLKPSSGEDSSTDRMIGVLADAFKRYGVKVAEVLRIADHDVKPGVTPTRARAIPGRLCARRSWRMTS